MNPISPDPAAPPANRRPLLLAGAGGAGVLLGLVLLMTLAGPDAAPPPASPPTTAPAEPEEADPPAGLDPELAFSVARDPFEQLVTAPDPEAATGPAAPEIPVPAEVPVAPAPPIPAPPVAAGTPPPAETAAPQPPAPAPAPAPVPAPAPAPAPAPQGDPPTPGFWYFPAWAPAPSQQPAPQPSPQQPAPDEPAPHDPPPEVLNDPVQLVRWMFEHLRLWGVLTDDAGTPRAFITVDDRAYLPAEGQVFGHHFRLERIDPGCVEVSTPTLHPGICVPTAGEAGDAPPGEATTTQACVVPAPAPSDAQSTERPRLRLTPCEGVAPEARFPVGPAR